jgi:hypothetical protein
MLQLRIYSDQHVPRRSALLNDDKSQTGREPAQAGACVATKIPLTGEIQ